MGSALHRIEILLIGLVMLIAAAVVVIVFARPMKSESARASTPQLIATIQPAHPAGAGIQETPSIPVATTAPGTPGAPIAPGVPQRTEADRARLRIEALSFLPSLRAAWPWLLLIVGLSGMPLVVLRTRTRRLPYTHQTMRRFLAAADPITHATNLRVMRQLAAQGVLTADLAVAAGMKLAQTRRLLPTLPRARRRRLPLTLPIPRRLTLAIPVIALPSIHITRLLPWCQLTLPGILRRPATARSSQQPGECSDPASPTSITAEAAVLGDDTTLTGSELPASNAAGAQVIDSIDIPMRALQDADIWTAEDRALAVAGVLGGMMTGLRSRITALDIADRSGSGLVSVTIDAHPEEEARLARLPDQIHERYPAWRTRWRRGLLEVMVATEGAQSPSGGPLLAPILAHGRGARMTRFLPLASWPHLGIYGSDALGALHTVLGCLLFAQAPSELALSIVDRGEIAPLYRGAAHLIPLPSSPYATLDLLAQAIRRGVWNDARPLLLVIVEPDDALLETLLRLVSRLHARPDTPLHLVIIQQQPLRAGRELYAALPALITGGGAGMTLPGQSTWPKPGEARLVAHGMRLLGRAIRQDEAAIAARVAQLRGAPGNLAPVLWHALAKGAASGPGGQAEELDTSAAAFAPNGTAADNPETLRRHIVARIVAERQRRLDDPASPLRPPRAPARPAPAVPNTVAIAPIPSPHVFSDAEMAEIGEGDQPIPQRSDETAPAALVEPATAEAPSGSGANTHNTTTAAAHVAVAMTLDDQGNASEQEHEMVADRAIAEPHQTVQETTLGETTWLGELLALDALPRDQQLSRMGQSTDASHDTASEQEPTAPEAEPDNDWPLGPAPLGRVALAELLGRIVTAPSITAGSNLTQIGLTQNRLVDLLKGQYPQSKELARTLLLWFELAGLLAPAPSATRWRAPRPLTTTELPTIAARLMSTPIPDLAAVRAAWET